MKLDEEQANIDLVRMRHQRRLLIDRHFLMRVEYNRSVVSVPAFEYI